MSRLWASPSGLAGKALAWRDAPYLAVTARG